MIDYILSDADDTILDRDYLTEKAAGELIIGCLSGIMADPKQVHEANKQIWKAINEGKSVSIDNPDTGVSMIFQQPSLKKERDAQH